MAGTPGRGQWSPNCEGRSWSRFNAALAKGLGMFNLPGMLCECQCWTWCQGTLVQPGPVARATLLHQAQLLPRSRWQLLGRVGAWTQHPATGLQMHPLAHTRSQAACLCPCRGHSLELRHMNRKQMSKGAWTTCLVQITMQLSAKHTGSANITHCFPHTRALDNKTGLIPVAPLP